MPLTVTPAGAPPGFDMPFEFAIAIGVRKGDADLKRDLDAALERRARDVAAVLDAYHVPRVGAPTLAMHASDPERKP